MSETEPRASDGFGLFEGSRTGDPEPAFLEQIKTHELCPGTEIGPYQLSGEALAGPRQEFGARPWVWRAWDRVNGREVVLKLYRREGITERVFIESAMAKRWSVLPNVAETYFAGEIGAWWAIAMEPMGETLERYLERRASELDLWRRDEIYLVWLRGIAQALNEVHESGQLHRDITPRNLMFTPNGETLKLLDFSHGKRDAGESVTARGELVGTVGHMAPEQYSNTHLPASDQYQLARVAWTLFTGASYPKDPNGRLSRPLRLALEKALSPDPGRREGSVLIFAGSLSAAVDGSTSPFLSALRMPDPVVRRVAGRIGPLVGLATVGAALAFQLEPRYGHVGRSMALWLVTISGGGVAQFLEGLLFKKLWRSVLDVGGGVRSWLALWGPALAAAATAVFGLWREESLGSPWLLAVMPGIAYLMTVTFGVLSSNNVPGRQGRWTLLLVEYLAGGRGPRRALQAWIIVGCAFVIYSVAFGFYISALRG